MQSNRVDLRHVERGKPTTGPKMLAENITGIAW